MDLQSDPDRPIAAFLAIAIILGVLYFTARALVGMGVL